MGLYSLLNHADRSWDPVEDAGADREGDRRLLGDILIQSGVLNEIQIRKALERRNQNPHRHIGEILVELGFADETTIARALAAQLGLQYVSLDRVSISRTAVTLINRRVAELYRAIPVYHTETKLVLAMANPLDLVAIDDLTRITGLQVDSVVATPSEVDAAIARCYSGTPGGRIAGGDTGVEVASESSRAMNRVQL